jgi:predicted nucleotidyltransferase
MIDFAMVSAGSILGLVEQIVEGFWPRQVILFGSYAYDTPDTDSDVDLLVVMPHAGPSHRKATEIRLSVLPQFPMDLLVRTPAQLRAGLAQNDWFVVEVLEKGIVLHDSADRAVGAKSRSRLRRRLAPAPIAQAKSA